MDASQILVIILAVALAILLVLSIILVSLLLKIAFQIKRITNTAEKAANKFESIAGTMQRASGPAAMAKLAVHMVRRYINKRKGEE